MDIVLEVSAPVFGVGLLGYFATKLGWFSRQSADGLADFVYRFAVPLLLFRTLAHAEPSGAGWHHLALVLGYYAPMAAFYCGGALLSRFVWRQDFNAQVITGFCCSYGNAILLGLPLALLTFGDAGAIPFFTLLALHSLCAFTVTTIALEYGRSRGVALSTRLARMASGIAANPIIIALLAGIAFNRIGLRIPAPLDALAALMQSAVLPCSLFALGAVLTGYGIAGHLKQTTLIIFVKCATFPLAVWLSCRYAFGVDPLWAMVATLLAAQPVGVNVFIFAERYRAAQALASTSVFLSTVFTLLTIPLLLYWIDLQGLR